MGFTISPIQPQDDPAIGEIIKQVGVEYGAIGEGFGPSDPEVLCMSEHYRDHASSRYFVAKVAGKVVGGGGIASFGDSRECCELKKLFILPQYRGIGIGRQLSVQCLDYARAQGYSSCYLDTLATMQAAIALYQQLGFIHLDHPLPGTEHNGCDTWMLKQLLAETDVS